MSKKIVLTLCFCMFLSGCSASSGMQRFRSFYQNLFSRSPETIRVEKGDTLYSLSKKYDISIAELIELNGLDSPDQLYVGQVLKTTSNKYYVVKRGDTLASIARKYNTNYKTLAEKNNISAPYNLKIGQKIVVSGNISGTSSKTTKASKSQNKSNQNVSDSTPVSSKRGSKFVWPVNGKIISSFGTIGKGRKNDGINISAPLGTTVKAGDKGTVAYAGNGLKGFGNLILIKHNDGYITAYAHTDKILVQKGQTVSKGEKIATVGKTGGVSSPQLHFEVRAGKKAVNPRNYLP